MGDLSIGIVSADYAAPFQRIVERDDTNGTRELAS
jgi:hypothetical protein